MRTCEKNHWIANLLSYMLACGATETNMRKQTQTEQDRAEDETVCGPSHSSRAHSFHVEVHFEKKYNQLYFTAGYKSLSITWNKWLNHGRRISIEAIVKHFLPPNEKVLQDVIFFCTMSLFYISSLYLYSPH